MGGMPEKDTPMFGRMMASPVVQVDSCGDLLAVVAALIEVTENVEIVRPDGVPRLAPPVPAGATRSGIRGGLCLGRKKGTW